MVMNDLREQAIALWERVGNLATVYWRKMR